jgi:hypothetical protein
MQDMRTLRVYVNERDVWQGRPLYEVLIERFRDLGAAGATVCRAAQGFGQRGRMHPAGRFGLSRDRPVVILVVDTRDRIERLLSVVDEMVTSGLATIT